MHFISKLYLLVQNSVQFKAIVLAIDERRIETLLNFSAVNI